MIFNKVSDDKLGKLYSEVTKHNHLQKKIFDKYIFVDYLMEIASLSPTIVPIVNVLLGSYYRMSQMKQALDKKLFYYSMFNYGVNYQELFYNQNYYKELVAKYNSEFSEFHDIKDFKHIFDNKEFYYLLYGFGLTKSTSLKELFLITEKAMDKFLTTSSKLAKQQLKSARKQVNIKKEEFQDLQYNF